MTATKLFLIRMGVFGPIIWFVHKFSEVLFV